MPSSHQTNSPPQAASVTSPLTPLNHPIQITSWAILFLLSLCLVACEEKKVVRDSWNFYRDLQSNSQAQVAGGWSDDPRVKTSDPSKSPEHKPPSSTLKALEDAQSQAASIPAGEWNLRPHTGMYSLQIGFYDDRAGKNYRELALQKVAKLRAQGHEAYIYHGISRSLITIGLFTDKDFTIQNHYWVYGSHIHDLQKTFPHNLANDQPILDPTPSKKPAHEKPQIKSPNTKEQNPPSPTTPDIQAQPSFLVQVK